MIRLLACVALAAVAGCTTYKLWNEAESDQDHGVVRLSYEYRKFESPQVDERAGVQMAKERCHDWGYPNATRKGEDRECTDGDKTDCRKWLVTREYSCTK